MKRIVLALFSCLLLLNSCTTTTAIQGSTAPVGSITYQTFYDDLSPYGNWIDYPGYGHVWSPGMDGEFRPYATNGHWVYSNEGWMWASDFSWGWAPFHYGRWFYDDAYGWLWIPGYDWSPAWVTWGAVDNYYCWAPLGPGVGVGAAYGGWRPHDYYWNQVPKDHMYDNDLSRVVTRPNSADRISVINNFSTTHRNNLYYSQGPNVAEVQRYTNRTITPMAIQETRVRGNAVQTGNNMQVYRPQVQNPQPRQFRSFNSNTTARPIMQMQDRPTPSIKRSEQIRNVNSLPMRTAPMMSSPSPSSRVRR
ncbi:DUF6600 domain-containing protein [Chitinophaga sancti]|uniref:DUF6600 domain-containing protein n=1 Tax=Chitinophaga sancti TaxID=1004 RepID=UPI002A74943C|nr:DUF6600 domain-containing protein [Chitinophaga sancti]WPQ65000.1 DUF6600 domain-containing protein [Chitinophaga sancti]